MTTLDAWSETVKDMTDEELHELLTPEEASRWFNAIAAKIPKEPVRPMAACVRDPELRELLAGVLAETRRERA